CHGQSQAADSRGGRRKGGAKCASLLLHASAANLRGRQGGRGCPRALGGVRVRRLHPPSRAGRRGPLPGRLPHAHRGWSIVAGMNFETPALLLDTAKVERNCRRMRERLQAEGVLLRPHVKTAKNVEVARMALGEATGPITVSTLREAEYFIRHGFTDILYAVGVVASKLEHIARLARGGASMAVIVDS